MGEEYGETHPFQYFVSHGDPELVDAVREGRQRGVRGVRLGRRCARSAGGGDVPRSKLDWSRRERAAAPRAARALPRSAPRSAARSRRCARADATSPVDTADANGDVARRRADALTTAAPLLARLQLSAESAQDVPVPDRHRRTLATPLLSHRRSRRYGGHGTADGRRRRPTATARSRSAPYARGAVPPGAATDVRVWPGQPYPLGATWDGEGVNFALFSENATGVELCLFDEPGRRRPRVDADHAARAHRSGLALLPPRRAAGAALRLSRPRPVRARARATASTRPSC